ncbi:MAG TPA: hypothetical protein VF170_00405, partial [Planctomycetaceae bacterium]
DARFIGGEDALEVDVRIDGSPVVCVVTAGALRELSRDRTDPDNVARVFREKEGFLRDVILEKVGEGRMPDRLIIAADDVRDRGY